MANDQLHKDSIGLSSEIDALNKHTSTLNGQNMSLQRELETFVQVDQTIQADLHRKAQIDQARRDHEAHANRSAMEFDRRRAESFEMERRRAHSRPLHETVVHHRVDPVPQPMPYDRYNARSANAIVRQSSPVREIGSRVAWKRPDERSFTTANTAATRNDLRKSE